MARWYPRRAVYGNRRYEQDAADALRALEAGEPMPLPGSVVERRETREEG